MKSEILFELERKLLDPSVRKNRTELEALLADDFLEFATSGTIWTKSSIIESLVLDEKYIPYLASDFQFRELAEKAVLITYQTLQISQEGSKSASLRSSIWKLNSGSWQMVFHQGTRYDLERLG